MKRFWKEVTVAEQGLLLDGKPVRTPGRAALVLPTPQLAAAVAEEWRGVGAKIDPRAMPLTGLANAAIDRVAPDPEKFASGLALFGESDLLCYRAELPEPLVERQAAHWDPLLDWARARYDVHFEVVTGVIHRLQPLLTTQRLRAAVTALDAFRLAGLAPLVTISGSLVIALALNEGAVGRDAAWTAAQVDEDWQAEQWGEDSLAAEMRDARRAEFAAAARFIALL